MRVLIIKTSSMGDIIHTLPALTDAGRAIPNITFDWIVEENFAEIPSWHPLVNKVYPVALRRWRKNLFSSNTRKEWRLFRNRLKNERYDLIIDAQGLVKSALLLCFVKGLKCGFDWKSAREPLASLFYQKQYNTGKVKDSHAITRIRKLFSKALNYSISSPVPDYGIDRRQFVSRSGVSEPYVVFLHGTTWETKHWPENYWIELAQKLARQNYRIKITWGNDLEQERAMRIALNCSAVEVLPKMKLIEAASLLAGSKTVVSVDTGLGHLAAALAVPTLSLFGPTDPKLTGALGQFQKHIPAKFNCAPCFKNQCQYREETPNINVKPPCFSTLNPDKVLKTLEPFLKN